MAHFVKLSHMANGWNNQEWYFCSWKMAYPIHGGPRPLWNLESWHQTLEMRHCITTSVRTCLRGLCDGDTREHWSGLELSTLWEFCPLYFHNIITSTLHFLSASGLLTILETNKEDILIWQTTVDLIYPSAKLSFLVSNELSKPTEASCGCSLLHFQCRELGSPPGEGGRTEREWEEIWEVPLRSEEEINALTTQSEVVEKIGFSPFGHNG